MKTTTDIDERKTKQGKRPSKKQSPQVGRKLSEEKTLRDMKTWFEENSSLHPLALFAKFYERF